MLFEQMNVLIVDDHLAVAKLVAKIFKSLNASRTVIASDTTAAHQHLTKHEPNVVVIDANSWPMRAAAFITLAKRTASSNPMILLKTTSLESDVVASAYAAGVDGILLQPFDTKSLLSTLNAAARSDRDYKPDPIAIEKRIITLL